MILKQHEFKIDFIFSYVKCKSQTSMAIRKDDSIQKQGNEVHEYNSCSFWLSHAVSVSFLSACQDKPITGVWDDRRFKLEPPFIYHTCIHRVIGLKDFTFIHTCVYVTNNVLIFELNSSEILSRQALLKIVCRLTYI